MCFLQVHNTLTCYSLCVVLNCWIRSCDIWKSILQHVRLLQSHYSGKYWGHLVSEVRMSGLFAISKFLKVLQNLKFSRDWSWKEMLPNHMVLHSRRCYVYQRYFWTSREHFNGTNVHTDQKIMMEGCDVRHRRMRTVAKWLSHLQQTIKYFLILWKHFKENTSQPVRWRHVASFSIQLV
jgi:hypothetical protein